MTTINENNIVIQITNVCKHAKTIDSHNFFIKAGLCIDFDK